MTGKLLTLFTATAGTAWLILQIWHARAGRGFAAVRVRTDDNASPEAKE